MKILIVAINAKYIHSNLAVYSLKAYAKKHLSDCLLEDGIRRDKTEVAEIEIAEYTINQYAEHILADIYRRKPDVIAMSCYIWNIGQIEVIIPELKKVLPEADIWLGGPEVSYDTSEVLDRLPVKGIMIGEGEETFYHLTECYRQMYERIRSEKIGIEIVQSFKNKWLEKHLEEIEGIFSNGFMTRVPQIMNMDELVFPYLETEQNEQDFRNRIVYYESSRGCPFSCAYCLSSIDKTVRFRSLELVKEELGFFLRHRVAQVKFVDRTFNCNHMHASEIWKYIKENDNGVTNFHFEIAADLLTEEELELLESMRPGLLQLEIGVQSVHDATIEEINRKTDFVRIAEVTTQLQRAHNIHLHLDLIAGLPEENYDTFVTSFNRVYALKPEQLQLGFLKVLKGSPMEQRVEKYELHYLSHAPYEVLSTRWISYEEILRLKAAEQMLEMYYNSSQFVNTLTLLEEAFADAFSLYAKLADFYEASGCDILQPSRMKKYEILFEFALKYDQTRIDTYRESLIMDLYLRENMKSRPVFAMDLEPYKDRIQAFYRNDDMRNKYLPAYADYDSRQISKMTHMEVFLRFGTETRDTEQPCYMLFDYRERDPLTQSAKTTRVTDMESPEDKVKLC